MRKIVVVACVLSFAGTGLASAAPVISGTPNGVTGMHGSALHLVAEKKEKKPKTKKKKSGSGGGMNMQNMPPGHKM